MLESYPEIEAKEPKKSEKKGKTESQKGKSSKIPIGKSKELSNEKVSISSTSSNMVEDISTNKKASETKQTEKVSGHNSEMPTKDTSGKSEIINAGNTPKTTSKDGVSNNEVKAKSSPEKKSKLRAVITSSATYKKLFVVVVAFISIYLIVAPILPALEYYVRDFFDLDYGESVVSRVTGNEDSEVDLGENGEALVDSDKNRVVIPKIGVNMAIVKGDNEDTLDLGSWIRPNASTPDKGSNTVLTAHRFNYIGGDRSFYNLDKLGEGDEVVVYWEGNEYKYIVEKNFVVKPDQLEIEAASRSPMLTLYTCTPLWTATNRLVVTAKPDAATLELIQSK